MAISQNSKILQSDIAPIYSAFNTFIASYGGSISQLSTPQQNDEVTTGDLNNLNNRIQAFKDDDYLKTQTAWWVKASDVTLGQIIQASSFTNINTTVSNFSKVKCRNQAYNQHSSRGHGSNGHSTNNLSTRGYSTNAHGSNNNGTCPNGPCTHWVSRNFDNCGSNGWNGNSPKWNGACTAWGACSANTDCTANGNCTSNGNCDANTNCTANGNCKNTQYYDITNSHECTYSV